MYNKILVPVDGSEGGWKALSYAKALAEKFGSKLVVENVVQPYTNASILAVPIDTSRISNELQEIGKQVLAMAKERLGGMDAEYKSEAGRPSKVIVNAVKETNADLVVIGSRGLSGIAEFFLGSVSSEVAQFSPVAVLIVK